MQTQPTSVRPKPRSEVMTPNLAVTRRLAAIALRVGGLTIDPERVDFFAQRIGKRIRALGLPSYNAYLELVESARGAGERTALVESLTTHTTSFFRENQHYDFLMRQGFRERINAGAGKTRDFRFWSAACSNGAELYSALICAKEFMAAENEIFRVSAVGTDISRAILKTASNAVYSEDSIAPLSEARRKAYLLRSRSGAPVYRIVPELRHMCRWTAINLTEQAPPTPVEVDVAFLRNVLIYFDRETQIRVVNTVVEALAPGGYLLTGHSETLTEPPSTIEQIASSTYRKQGG